MPDRNEDEAVRFADYMETAFDYEAWSKRDVVLNLFDLLREDEGARVGMLRALGWEQVGTVVVMPAGHAVAVCRSATPWSEDEPIYRLPARGSEQ